MNFGGATGTRQERVLFRGGSWGESHALGSVLQLYQPIATSQYPVILCEGSEISRVPDILVCLGQTLHITPVTGEFNNMEHGWEKGRLCVSATQSGVCSNYSHITGGETETRKKKPLTQFTQVEKQSRFLYPQRLVSEMPSYSLCQ